MAKGTGRANPDRAVHEADTSAIITQENLGEVPVERRDQYLKRIKKEDKANAKAFKKMDEHLVIQGRKVLRKLKNASGSGYTFYWFNTKRHKAYAKILMEKGELKFGTPDSDGGERMLKLLFVDGQPFKPKG